MDKIHSVSDSPSAKRKEDSEICTPLKKDDCNIQYGSISKEDENVALIGSENKDQNNSRKLWEILTTLTTEPLIFSFMFAFLMNISVLTNMMMDKGCLYHLNYSSEICYNLSNYQNEKYNVDKLATNYSLYANLTSFIAAFFMVFIAPWSDKYSRKIPLLISVVGATLTDIGIILCVIHFESRLVYLVISRLPSEFSGGFICMLTIIFSHASEVSSEKNRTLKYTSLEIAMGLGIALGGLTGGFLYRYYGYFYVYVTIAALHSFCFLWTLFVVEETTGLDVDMKWHEKARDFFTCVNFKSGFAATFRPREGNARALLILLLLSLTAIVLNYEAFGSISYVYVHNVYDWDPTVYSIVNTSALFTGLMASLIMVPIFVKIFKFRDFTLGLIGSISMIGKNIFIAFSKYHTYIYYIAQVFGIFTSLSTLAVRSGISKLVDKDELGRVFAFVATCEAVIPLMGNAVITQLFNATMNIFPNVSYTTAGAFLLLPLGTFIWALKITKNPYNALNVSTDQSREKV